TAALGLGEHISYEAAQPSQFHPGRTAAIVLNDNDEKQIIGYVGQLHPELQRQSDLEDTFVVELELAPLYELASSEIVYKALPRYPAITRDIAVVVEADVQVGNMVAAIKEAAGELLESVQVFDVFTGERLRSEEHTSELQSRENLVCRLLLEKK